MKKRPSSFLYWRLCWLCILVLTLTACTGDNPNPVTDTHAQSANTGSLGTQPCPELVNAASYWEPIVPTQSNINQIESITCANIISTDRLQALITVRANGSGAGLEVYVYDHITQPNPERIFQLQGLTRGEAQLSAYNTILTSEVNKAAEESIDRDPDIFREFQWSTSLNGFVPVAFPGLYPHLTRFQAERSQKRVDEGQDAWQLDASQVASNFVTTLLGWPEDTSATITSGGTENDTSAVATVTSSVSSKKIQVSMERLSGRAKTGIWIVTKAETENAAITTPVNLDRVTSPAAIAGTGEAGSNVVIYDSSYEKLAEKSVTDTNFSTTITYTSSFPAGMQDGLVVLQLQSGGVISGIAVSKVLIQ